MNSLTKIGGQVGFAEQRGLVNDAGTDGDSGGLEDRGDQAAEFLHAHRLVEVAAQVFLEGHGLEHLDAIAERDFLVGVPEETGIVEAGAEDTLVAVADEAVGIAVGVQDGEEVRRELAVGVFEREVLLVVAHDGD